MGVLIIVLMVVCITYTIINNEGYRKWQMTGKETAVFKAWKKFKAGVKDYWTKQRGSMKVYIVLFIIALILVIWICGINGNNDSNFWIK